MLLDPHLQSKKFLCCHIYILILSQTFFLSLNILWAGCRSNNLDIYVLQYNELSSTVFVHYLRHPVYILLTCNVVRFTLLLSYLSPTRHMYILCTLTTWKECLLNIKAVVPPLLGHCSLAQCLFVNVMVIISDVTIESKQETWINYLFQQYKGEFLFAFIVLYIITLKLFLKVQILQILQMMLWILLKSTPFLIPLVLYLETCGKTWSTDKEERQAWAH